MKRKVVSLSAATVILLLIGLIFSGVGGAQATPLTSGGPPDTLPARVQPIAQYVPESSSLVITNSVGSGVVTVMHDGLVWVSTHFHYRIILSAAASTGWKFNAWTGAIAGTTTSISADFPSTELLDPKIVTATFIINTYAITPTAGANGSITPATAQTVNYGADQAFAITANTGYHIVDVGVDGVSVGATDIYTFANVMANHTITAEFAIDTFVITPTAGANGSITPASAQTVNYGADQAFAIAANTGYQILDVGVDGVSVGAADFYTFTNIASNHTITASFETANYTLTLDVGSLGGGNVSLDPPGGVYTYGTIVTMTATPDTGWFFVGWVDEGIGPQSLFLNSSDYIVSVDGFIINAPNNTFSDANPIQVTIIESLEISALFDQITCTLDYSIVGGGLVSVEPPQSVFNYGDVVTLTADAYDPCWGFTSWSGDISGSDIVTSFVIVTDTSVTATFDLQPIAVDITVVGLGSVYQDPDQATYLCDAGPNLYAIASTGWYFVGWSGAVTGTTNLEPLGITGLGSPVVITATFAPITYHLDLDTVGQGTVTKNPSQATYIYNEVVTLTANPKPGWYLFGWSGDVSGTDNPKVVTIYANTIVTATFEPLTYTLNVIEVGEGDVAIDPLKETYLYGDVVTLTATTDNCHHLAAWSGDATGSEVVKIITIHSSMNITATFDATPAVITENVVGNGLITSQPDHSVLVCGDMLTFTASSANGWYFVGWEGAVTGSAMVQYMTITDPNVVVTATFEPFSYTLTVDKIGQGSVSKDPDQALYIYGDKVTLTATPDPGWYLVGWSGAASGNALSTTITIQSDVLVTATFEQITYTLGVDVNVDVEGNGSVTIEPQRDTYLYGDVVTLTASSEPCYTFIGWSGDATGSELVKVITITGNTVITATFDPTIAIITRNVVGDGFVTVQPAHPLLTCGDDLTFTASANFGWYFAGWSGDVSGPANPTAMTITDPNVVVTATFEPYSYSLVINTVGQGSVSKDPDQLQYVYNDVVTLTANPEPGWYLYSWSGAVSGTSNPQAVTILGNTVVTATFRRFTYTVSVNVVGTGNVDVDPTQATYQYGDVVTLTASTDDCHSLTAWSGDLSGNELVKVITIEDSYVITATFDLIPAVITANVVGNGTVVVQPDPAAHVLTCGSLITVTAVAQPGWNFDSWSGDVSGTNVSRTLTITDPNVVITATFTPTRYTLKVNTVGNGTVGKDPDQATYIYNDVVTLTAVPDAGWYLVGWSGDASGMDNPLAVTIQSNRVITATFAQLTYTLNVNVVGTGNVGIDPTQATYLYGDVVTLTASTDICHHLVAWSGDATGSEVVKIITIHSSMNITATFDATPAVITENVVGNGFITVQPAHPVLVCGDVLTVTASADRGWNFDGWSGAVTGSGNPVSMTITDPNVVITATFSASNYMLRIDRIGNGSVDKNPDKGDAYINNDVVTLTAIPDPGWYLVGWAGAASGSAVETTIVIHANTIVTATFAQLTYTVTANVVGIGSVDWSPKKATYLYGDMVTLTASTDVCHSLTAWSGSLSGNELVRVFTITSNVVATATFDLTPAVVTKNVLGKGSVIHQPSHPNLVCGDALTFTAVSDTGWYFAGWSGAVTGNSNQVAMTITDPNVVVTATFEPFSYTLAVGTVGNGTVSKEPDLLQYIYGDVVTLTANPAPGWYLVAWSGNASGNANPKIITITGNTVITATFDRITYTVDTLVQGGVGTVTRVPSQTTYYYGDIVSLTVVPAPCNFFVDWSGDASGTLVQTTVTVTKNMMIYANLTPSTHTVTANVVGLGSVLQLPGQPGYGCETSVMLVAMPASGWKFAGWSGDISGLNPVATVIINNANVVVTATFEVFTFSLHENIVGNGSVLVDPIQDHESYSYGDVVTLTAVPDPGWYLIGWSGDASGNANPLTVTITTNTHVTATFGKITYTLELKTVGNGTASKQPDQATYFYGDVVTLTASANTCSIFSSWSGDASGTSVLTTLTISGNAVVTATFVPATYTITSNVVGKGEVTYDPMAASYLCGSVKLDAFPAMGWFFTGWSGDASGTYHQYWLEIIGRDMVVTATFEPYTYTLDVDIVGNGSVAIDPDLNTYIYGDVVTLTASPDPGWYLVGWSGNASGTGNPAVVTIHANTVVTATFARITYTLTTVVHSGIGTVIVSPAQATYYYGDEVTITAVPGFGWFFIGWTGDVVSDHLSVVATIYDNMTVSASFGNYRTFVPLTFTVVPMVLSPK